MRRFGDQEKDFEAAGTVVSAAFQNPSERWQKKGGTSRAKQLPQYA